MHFGRIGGKGQPGPREGVRRMLYRALHGPELKLPIYCVTR